jgi:hypothetical protein
MYLARAFLAWLAIILAESVHSALRELFLAPLVGDFRARRIAVFVGSGLILLLACFFIRWIAAPTAKALFLVGSLWTLLTLFFELALGFLILGLSRERVFEDYDISRGGLMAFGVLFMIFAPYLAARLRGCLGRSPVA